jgi:hypothetical protein
MVDMSKTVFGDKCILRPHDGKVQVIIDGFTAWWLTDKQARDLWQALNVWVERNAEVE